MENKKVWAVYFSATGTTQRVVVAIADTLAAEIGALRENVDFTLPGARVGVLRFSAQDIVIIGTPVYAGRVPNVLLTYLATLEGNGALAVPIVLYGNRHYDNALIELRDIMQDRGFQPVAAGAFVGEHSFSTILAKGRPDAADMALVRSFAGKVADKLGTMENPAAVLPLAVAGVPKPYGGYYQPRDRHGNPVDIRKVKPLTNNACIDCKICADSCPMGSINPNKVSEVSGICIKCCACVKKCPVQAKEFADSAYLYHQQELEDGLTRRAEPEWFL